MKRYVSLEEISDGKLYKAKDLARADCLGCKGCSQCCRGMGESIVLDPLDVFRLTTGLGRDLQSMLSEGSVEWNVVDGLVLPNLKMAGAEEKCSFLDEEGRCSIHPFRPGICRLFPLGRYYGEHEFWYILQTGECGRPRAKIQIGKWLDTPDLPRYETFVWEWHCLLTQARKLQEENQEGEFSKNLNLFLLRTFYMKDYSGDDFYGQFRERISSYREIVPPDEDSLQRC